jgi:hypothetical protein
VYPLTPTTCRHRSSKGGIRQVRHEVAANPVNEMVRRLISTLKWVILLAGSRRIIDMQIRSVGIDLVKTAFHLVALTQLARFY